VYLPLNGSPKVLQANLIGNSYHQWMNEPTGFHVISEHFEDMQSSIYSNDQQETTKTYIHSWSMIAFFIFIFLVVCLLLKMILYL